MKSKNTNGLTLIEIMISVALLSIVAASAISMYVSGQAMNKANNDRQTVYKALQEAVEQVKKTIDTAGANQSQPFISKNSFDVIDLNITLRGAGPGARYFDDDGEDLGAGNGTQLGRVVVESVNMENDTVDLDDANMLRITAEVKVNFPNGGIYLDERLISFIRK